MITPVTHNIARLIESSPDDARLYQLLADELERAGDPRGELISLHIAGKGAPLAGPKLSAALGPLHRYQESITVWWRWGCVEGVRVDHEVDHSGQFVDALAAGAPFLRRFELACRWGKSSLVEAMGQRVWPTLNDVSLGNIVSPDAGRLSLRLQPSVPRISGWCPNLESLALFDGEVEITSMPRLKGLKICGDSLDGSVLRSLGTAQLPALSRLELWLRGKKLTKPLVRLLAERKWPGLESLAVRYPTDVLGTLEALFDSQLARSVKALDLIGTPLAAQDVERVAQRMAKLETLSLTVTDENARAIATSAWPSTLTSLRLFESRSPASSTGLPSMSTVLPRIVSLDLHPRSRPGARDELRRYAEKQSGHAAAVAWRALADVESRLFNGASAAWSHIASGEALRQEGALTNAWAELERALSAVDRVSRVGQCAVQAMALVMRDRGQLDVAAQLQAECLSYFRDDPYHFLPNILLVAALSAFEAGDLDVSMSRVREGLATPLHSNARDSSLRSSLTNQLDRIGRGLTDATKVEARSALHDAMRALSRSESKQF